MLFEVTRDADGRPQALRLKLGGWGLGTRLRALRRFVPGAVTSSAAAVVKPLRVAGRAALSGVPQVSYRHDASGQVAAVVLRFGVDAAADDRSIAQMLRDRWAQARESLKYVAARAAAWMPRPALDRGSRGEVVAVRLRTAPDVVPAAGASDERQRRAPKWVIEPVGAGFIAQMEDFWRHRRTLWYFSERGVRRMYQGTNLGMFWLFARPLLPIFISTVIFGRLLGVPSEGVPYFLFFLAGTTSWMLFERSVMWATRSLDLNKNLIKKVYFPRLIVPISSVAPAVVDALTYSGLLLAAAIYYVFHDHRWYLRIGPSLGLALFACVMSVVFAIAVGLWTSVWQVRVREMRYTVRYVMRFWSYLTPVMYPLSEIPARYQWIVFLNPMAPFVETFKWGLLGIGEFNVGAFSSGVVVALLMLTGGIWYFNRSEATAVDRL